MICGEKTTTQQAMEMELKKKTATDISSTDFHSFLVIEDTQQIVKNGIWSPPTHSI